MDVIYKMKLNEVISVDNITTVRRVPGGWIYVEIVEHRENVIHSTSTFVPFNDEFMIG